MALKILWTIVGIVNRKLEVPIWNLKLEGKWLKTNSYLRSVRQDRDSDTGGTDILDRVYLSVLALCDWLLFSTLNDVPFWFFWGNGGF